MKMSARISRNLHLLNRLQNATPTERKNIIKNAPIDFILSLCEIAYNVLKGRIPLVPKLYKKFKSKKKWLKAVAKKAGSHTMKRKRMLCQRGGFLPALINVAIPFLTSLITSRV